jgi:hypothetical protein
VAIESSLLDRVDFRRSLDSLVAPGAIELDRIIFKSPIRHSRNGKETHPKYHHCRDQSFHGSAPKIDHNDHLRQTRC